VGSFVKSSVMNCFFSLLIRSLSAGGGWGGGGGEGEIKKRKEKEGEKEGLRASLARINPFCIHSLASSRDRGRRGRRRKKKKSFNARGRRRGREKGRKKGRPKFTHYSAETSILHYKSGREAMAKRKGKEEKRKKRRREKREGSSRPAEPPLLEVLTPKRKRGEEKKISEGGREKGKERGPCTFAYVSRSLSFPLASAIRRSTGGKGQGKGGKEASRGGGEGEEGKEGRGIPLMPGRVGLSQLDPS